ncbi:uncharacterized protein LOC126575680 isoform X1 [Anopheles aquasalis]|uniref:uncharacterized protein LOC126575680 isoform X1 n=1 Tax=Anopheles aquasalis TaxID=42839 RepID=UPI00215AB2FD|nr:uncharacterized protein LOC126575680 isoform X1 [Anopheles aquasalis]
MERALRRYVKVHGYAVAMAALFFGCIFVASIVSADQLNRTPNECTCAAVEENEQEKKSQPSIFRSLCVLDAFFRTRPLEQLIFSIAWIVAGMIFLLGLICERKEAIFPFATMFLVEWSLLLVQMIGKVDHRGITELLLSAEAAVFLLVPLYVGYTLVILYRVFDNRYKEEEDDLEQQATRLPVKFFFGDEPDDSYS